MDNIKEVVKAIDKYLAEYNLEYTKPPEANRYLAEKGILNDSPSRPGLPLRNMLRDGKIPHAYPEGGKNSSWIIPHSYYGPFYNPSFLSKEQFKEGLMEVAKDSELEIFKAFFRFDNCEANGDAIRGILGKKDVVDINRETGNLGNRLASNFKISHFSKKKGERMGPWNVSFQGRRDGQLFIWILRQELKEAMIELGLDTIPYPGEEIQSFQKTYHEGGKTTVQISQVERSAEARKACLEKYGHQCQACGMTFFERYGAVAKDFIHVHHKNPVSQKDEPSDINPEEDLVPLCPNCHAVAHMRKPEPYSVEEIKAMLNDY